MNFFLCFLFVAFLVGVYAQCGQRMDSLYQCLDRVEQGSDWSVLKQRKMQLAQQCVARNYTWQTCWNDMNKMSTCTERYYQGNNNNPQMQSQKQQLMTDFDNCARNNPTSPFVVMMREEGKKAWGSGKLTDMSMDGPMVNCLKTFTQGILESFMNPRDVAPVLQSIGLNADVMSDMDMMAPTEACRPFQDCLMTATMGTVNDQQITTAARNIYNQKEKCKADFGIPFECISSSKEQDQCTEKVIKVMLKAKMENIKQCMMSNTVPLF